MKFVYILSVAIIIFVAWKTSWLIGILATLFIGAVCLYMFLPEIYKVKGRKAFAAADYKGAKAWFEKAVKTGRAKIDTAMEYSYVLLRTGDVDDAERVVSNVLARKVSDKYKGRAIIQRCMCYYKQGNLDEALEDAMDLYNDGFRSIMLYGMIGYFKILKDPMSDDTMNFCLEAYDYDDENRDICDNLTICYYNRGKYEEAKEIADKLLENNTKSVEPWYHSAQVDYKLGLYKEALEKLDKTAECNRSYMTTVSVEEIEALKAEIKEKMK